MPLRNPPSPRFGPVSDNVGDPDWVRCWRSGPTERLRMHCTLGPFHNMRHRHRSPAPALHAAPSRAGYSMHSTRHTPHAGQAVIQFARDRNNDRVYAIKFFLSHSAFAAEAALYTDRHSPLGPFLPQLRNIVGAPGHEPPIFDAHGHPLPPCIVMEKGESLDVWMQRNRGGVDMITGLQVRQLPPESRLSTAPPVHSVCTPAVFYACLR